MNRLFIHDFGSLLVAALIVSGHRELSLHEWDTRLEKALETTDLDSLGFRVRCDLHGSSKSAQEIILGLLQRHVAEIHHDTILCLLPSLEWAHGLLLEFPEHSPMVHNVASFLPALV